MQIEAKTVLYDIQLAVSRIQEFTHNANFEDYQRNVMMRSAVKRQFEIIGEAVNRLSDIDGDLAYRITERRRIINFRNLLIHGYSVVDDRLVWDVIHTRLPILAREIAQFMNEIERRYDD